MHPILVLIPVGSWIASFVLDIVFLATGATFWFIAAMWVMVIGIVGALLAAATGFYDLFTLPIAEQPKKTGLSHMTLNLIIVVLYLINVLAFRMTALVSPIRAPLISSSTAAWGFVLNLIAVVLLLVSGWLGGEMIYRYGVAIPHETMQRAPQYETRGAMGRTDVSGSLGGESGPDQPA